MSSLGRSQTLIGTLRMVCLTTAFAVAGSTFGADPIPEFYGIYVVDEGQLLELKGEFGQDIGQRTPNVQLLVFDKQVAFLGQLKSFRLARMKWLRNEIELVGQRVLVGRPLNATEIVTAVGQWLSVGRSTELDIELRSKPVPGQPEMVYLVPRARLGPGTYEVLSDGSNIGLFRIHGEAETGVHDPNLCVDRVRWGPAGGPASELIPCGESAQSDAPATSQAQKGNGTGRLREYLDRSPPASDERREQFRDPKLGFGFSYPATFELQPRNVRHSLIGLTPPNAGVEGTTKAMIFVEVGKTPLLDPNPSVSGIIERQIAATVGNLTGSVVTGPMETTIAGQKAQVFFSSGTRDGHSEEQAITIGVGHKRWMKVNLVVQGGSLDQYLDEYRRVCDSMELL